MTPIIVVAESPGFLKNQIDLRLAANQFGTEWVTSPQPTADGEAPTRTVTLDANMSDKVLAGEQVRATYETSANALTREFEEIRIYRALYTVLADIVIADATPGPLSAEALITLERRATRVATGRVTRGRARRRYLGFSAGSSWHTCHVYAACFVDEQRHDPGAGKNAGLAETTRFHTDFKS